MSQKGFFMVTGVVFSAVAVLHALRLAYGWPAMIGTWNVPAWLSILGLLLGGYLAIAAFRFCKVSGG